ncbi:polyribonucleotide nucleotidyltransferase [SCandidatus Aminicenantes bacterium Aminicenantia_JdfR_composite]|jgi:polyribonucleotide nucleotidyltransferase|nr:polyribonucleotide nucleotidyltransferase [SCandidatus Aminicenantes bacterium Aminicenantia_JdfR_composite]MCP2597220.1 polyribonucleotide nucleotidyltransferase [Candidatus Aminicenantes bacterium AC-335-G13]MCP2597718.1 polyribonucleotide nucleotidyltransferase [Candidatus Aminicenantes bacterium AC-335-L06]
MQEKVELEIGGRNLIIEIGNFARQADGSAMVRYGDTIMLVTATSRKEVKEIKDFLPLIVDYRESTFAAGKIPGGFFKREGKPTEREILVSRLIDRPIRPLFPEKYFNDTQIIALLLSADLENEPDTLGIIGASVALYLSDIPFTVPVGAVKIGLINDEFIINPSVSQLDSSKLNLTVAGTEDGIVMVEGSANNVEDEKIVDAIVFAQKPIQQIIEAQKELANKLKIQKRTYQTIEILEEEYKKIEDKIGNELEKALLVERKLDREENIKEIYEKLSSEIPEEDEVAHYKLKKIFDEIIKKTVRRIVLETDMRVDGRKLDEIRPISIKVGFLPRTHGSALFTRGETQALVTATLGTFEDVQRLDGLGEEDEKRFMVHYNFPPFCVGEVSFLRAPGRREIGHGALAEKAILPAIPDEEKFPYTIRIVSDILESNGSSSMATVCGGTLALMDAGVPISMKIAGIAMGLITENDKYKILTDIIGLEDHYGDMDFKVAGTETGITAIQMDIKIKNINSVILKEALVQAREARKKILEKMKEAIAEPRADISSFAPRIKTIIVNPDKISDIIGPGGKNIKKIISQTHVKVDIEENGKITIAANDAESAEKAIQMIREITQEAEVGKVYTGKVVRIEDYGAFVEILPNIVGLLHISEIAHRRIKDIRKELKVGQQIKVKVIDIDQDHRIKLSKKALDPQPSYYYKPTFKTLSRKTVYKKKDKDRFF